MITDAGVTAIAKGCPALTSIDLGNCCHITDKGVAALAVACKKLTTINLYSCIAITERCLWELASGCLLLTELKSTCSEAEREVLSEVGVLDILIMGATTVIKLGLWIWCKAVHFKTGNVTVRAAGREKPSEGRGRSDSSRLLLPTHPGAAPRPLGAPPSFPRWARMSAGGCPRGLCSMLCFMCVSLFSVF